VAKSSTHFEPTSAAIQILENRRLTPTPYLLPPNSRHEEDEKATTIDQDATSPLGACPTLEAVEDRK
jgi:hypothetical protein